MSTQAIRLTALHYDVERAISRELSKSRPNALRLFRLRRTKGLLKDRFRRLIRRA
ncbi:hypothetical protein GCM10022280_08040 [Sphingomonas swuensis]|uniref:DUF465 domain-containing protein n=1 Tax=Sphingomonas swuensis TaxID=977800 RepID=A0ABP7SJJ3_9SPHN